jgi:hypothetical protein
MKRIFFAVALLGCALYSPAAVIWNEAVDGDLSNNRLAPTTLNLPGGIDVIQASTSGGDREYMTLIIPTGCKLDRLVLTGYQSADVRAFIGIQRGSTFTEDPNSANVANLLGYAHFGPGANPVGTDLLPLLGTAPGAQGFSGPLLQGTFTYWVQQLGAKTDWEMQWHISAIPEPATMVSLAMGSFALAARRRRR